MTKTLLVLIVDRSGSMSSIRSDAEGGIHSLIESQEPSPQEPSPQGEDQCLLTLVQFDHEYEFVHKAAPIKGLPPYKLVPRGMTALLDAVGRALSETKEYVSALPEEDRPGLVSVVITTDGHENSSKEFTKDQILALIKARQDEDKWVFTFVGADASAFDVAQSIGIAAGSSAQFTPNGEGTRAVYASLGGKLTRTRMSVSRGDSADQVAASNEFTSEERGSMTKP